MPTNAKNCYTPSVLRMEPALAAIPSKRSPTTVVFRLYPRAVVSETREMSPAGRQLRLGLRRSPISEPLRCKARDNITT